MAKYNFEFKKKVVLEYLDGKGGTPYLSKKYGLGSDSQLRKWINTYKAFGDEGLMRSRKQTKYSFEKKISVVESYLSSEISYQDLAIQEGITNPSMITNWVNRFRVAGPDALRPRKKGRKKTLDKPKIDNKPITQENSVVDTSAEHVKELEDELLKLRIENAFLKELRRLRLEDEAKMRERRSSSTASEEKFKLKDLLSYVGMPKATYMYWRKRFDRENPDKEIEEKILEIRVTHKDYGYRRMVGELRNQGYSGNKKKVQRIMQKLGLQVTSFTRKNRKYSSYNGKVGTVAPNRIKRRFNTHIPHQKITTDTTEFKYYEIDVKGHMTMHKLYLDPFMDMCNGEIISFGIARQPSAKNVMDALEQAIATTSDCPYRRTFHSDQGWAYQMKVYTHRLKKNRIFQSMSRKGNCHDNSVMENFFGLLKQEIYHGVVYYSYEELKSEIERYIKYYNEQRIKEKLGWMSPVQYRLSLLAA
ncbi:IS3 family transposase [Campylobacter sp. RM9344]|uniref:IS3 family transposase n=1 Tax=Campylobacter californiensis TaxID=1032243 RepID=A0AAW3ZXI4_9BACT|nr:IS3 family transposase [Campylobacter sp. RM6883]MBE2995735.1 IS3 family transposase [Campylobacter sp. RM6913]MBE3029112.1 IS3 family transposase [Campylobacter sp. RM9344]MBE3608103.1 IS3 family transposase [Campylobacter sp. RM9337]